MNTFIDFFQTFLILANSNYALFVINIFSTIVIATIIIKILQTYTQTKTQFIKNASFVFFLIPIIAIMIDNIAWIVHFLLPKTTLARAIICCAWILSSLKFHSLIIFLEKITTKNFQIKKYHYALGLIDVLLCCSFIINTIQLIMTNKPFLFVINFYYIAMFFWFISCIILVDTLRKQQLPLIIFNQIKILIFYFFCPILICILLEFFPIIAFGHHQLLIFSNLSTLLMTASLYFCFKKIMQFRFLNLSDHVQIKPNLQTVINFKEVIEQINIATTPQELTYISKDFCFEHCNIEKSNTIFYIRNDQQTDTIHKKIEHFLNTESSHKPIDILIKHKILVAHEIEFDEFYTQDPVITLVSDFLRALHADIFVPIIHNQQLLGAIIIECNQEKILYSKDTQNTLMVFAQFLAPCMYHMQHQNILALFQESKEIKNSLHEKHQEIAQYQESIKQLLKDRIEHHIGILFCKGKQFHIKNHEAEKLLGFNPNLQPDHPTSLTLMNFAQKIEKFQTTSNMCLLLSNGQKLMISGMPQTHVQAGVLLVIRKPEATDLIKMHFDSLKNNSDRDYLLYLETTQIGRKINQLLPSNLDIFINIKIKLLQATLQKSALFLQMHENDIDTIVNVLTQFDLDQQSHIITLSSHESDIDHIIFGTNPLLCTNQEIALLEKINNGTLIIKNIEYLSKIIQQKLAYFIRYGIFTPLKSEQRKFAHTRIICTTSHNLSQLHHDGIIIPELLVALNKHSIEFPSLITMPEHQLNQLIDGFMYQHMQNDAEKILHSLTPQDKQVIIDKRIASVFTLQQKVYHTMTNTIQEQKSFCYSGKKNTTIFHTNPEITRAAQLGKHALKDIQLMKSLWKQLGNQTKIADLLGVNRSSVNRRCKEYNLV